MNKGQLWTPKELEQLKADWGTKPPAEKTTDLSMRIQKNYPGRSADSVRGMLCMMLRRGEIEKPEAEAAEMPNVLFMDIETLSPVYYSWGPDPKWLNPKQMIRDWGVLCWSAIWYGDDTIMGDCLHKNEIPKDIEKPRNDKRICASLWELFDDADIIVVQNGKRFDIPKMHSRWLFHRNNLPSSYKVIDTLLTARSVLGQTYNSLDELGAYYGLGRKIKTDMQLWIDCDHGDQDALDKMLDYCGRDVELLRDVYERMRPMIPNHPNFAAYSKAEGVCPVCLDPGIKRLANYHAAVKEYKQWRCNRCGSLWHSRRAEK